MLCLLHRCCVYAHAEVAGGGAPVRDGDVVAEGEGEGGGSNAAAARGREGGGGYVSPIMGCVVLLARGGGPKAGRERRRDVN